MLKCFQKNYIRHRPQGNNDKELHQISGIQTCYSSTRRMGKRDLNHKNRDYNE